MASFDERAKSWDVDPAKVERALVVANAIRTQVLHKPGMNALEYGCGTGLLGFALQQDFASITLADTSQGMLDVLAGKIKRAGVGNMHPLLLNLVSEPAPSAHFDIIFTLMSMHHILETITVLKKFFSMLTKGGFLCIADLEKEDGSFHGPQITDVHNGFERNSLQKQVETAGFGMVRFSSIFSVRKQVGEVEKAFPMFLMVARKDNDRN